jgi:hypothetical protein
MMPEHKKEPDKPSSSQEKDISWVAKGGIFLFFILVFIGGYISNADISNHVGSFSNFTAYMGFFLSCFGMFYISYKVFSVVSMKEGHIKYFTQCELPSRLNLEILLLFSMFIVIFTALKTKGWLSSNVADSIVLTALVFPLVFVAAKQTRTATILLVLFALYFFSGIFFSKQSPDGYFISITGGILLVVISLGFVSLIFQKPQNETLLDWTKELQENRRESKEILHLLSEFPDAKEISNIMKIPLDELENTQRPLGRTIQRAVWDLEYEAHQGFEKKLSSSIREAKKEFISEVALEINKIKEHSQLFNIKDEKNHVLNAIEQSEKHLESIKQHIQIVEKIKPHLEKVKVQLTKTSPRSSFAIVHINGALDNIDSFQKNITPALKEAVEVFEKVKPYIKQQESKHNLIEKEIHDALKKIQEKAREMEK